MSLLSASYGDPMRTALFPLITIVLTAQQPFQIEDLYKVKKPSSPSISAKGEIAYQLDTPDVAGNRTERRIHVIRQGKDQSLDLGKGNATRPQFSPDGSKLAYEQGGQIWILDRASQAKKQLTKLPNDATGALWSPDGQWIAFTSTTVPGGDPKANEAYVKAQEASKVKARHYSELMFRHWNEWKDPKQVSHLFVVKADGSQPPRDLTPGFKEDVPAIGMFAAGDDVAWAPDSKSLAFCSNPDQFKAISTNGEIYEVALAGGSPKKLSDNPANDTTPRYSPCGKFLAWRAQRRPGFEADKFELWIQERASGKILFTTQKHDRSVSEFAWSSDALVFEAEDWGRAGLFRWDPTSDKLQALTTKQHFSGFTLDPKGTWAVAQSSGLAQFPELMKVELKDGQLSSLTQANTGLTKAVKLAQPKEMRFPGAGGTPVQQWILEPAKVEPGKKYPVLLFVHGGPQNAWNDSWHPRWNGQPFAAHGYYVILVNPRGSTGFGQSFVDEISGDWGGKVVEDILKGLDAFHAAYPQADPGKVVAAGGSFGGYMTNWLAAHHPDRFQAFLSHAGVYNLESMSTVTEELWFPYWENGQKWPWEDPKSYEKFSPHRYAAKFKKPMLVVHGELDFRVPVDQGFQNFQTHRLRGIPAELLIYPDEAHFVARPQNSKLWYETVTQWFDRWVK